MVFISSNAPVESRFLVLLEFVVLLHKTRFFWKPELCAVKYIYGNAVLIQIFQNYTEYQYNGHSGRLMMLMLLLVVVRFFFISANTKINTNFFKA